MDYEKIFCERLKLLRDSHGFSQKQVAEAVGVSRTGYIYVDSEKFHGDIRAFRCYGDSMNGIGILDGDIAIVRMQDKVESGELEIVVVNGGQLPPLKEVAACKSEKHR